MQLFWNHAPLSTAMQFLYFVVVFQQTAFCFQFSIFRQQTQDTSSYFSCFPQNEDPVLKVCSLRMVGRAESNRGARGDRAFGQRGRGASQNRGSGRGGDDPYAPRQNRWATNDAQGQDKRESTSSPYGKSTTSFSRFGGRSRPRGSSENQASDCMTAFRAY